MWYKAHREGGYLKFHLGLQKKLLLARRGDACQGDLAQYQSKEPSEPVSHDTPPLIHCLSVQPLWLGFTPDSPA